MCYNNSNCLYHIRNEAPMVNFLKGIIVGLGGIAPGLSGSVLLIIFGLYYKTLDALATLFRDFRKKIAFLLPLLAGMAVGVLLFSNALDYFLTNYEVPTRFCFLGLILGTVPLFYKETKKNGFAPGYYGLILASWFLGTWMFTLNPNSFPQISDPSLPQSVFLGIAVAATAIIPGVDPAVLLSSLGLYEVYVRSLANLDFGVLVPMALGVGIGAIGISKAIGWLFRRFYTGTYSVIFGLFLSMIPNILSESCTLGWSGTSAVSLVLMVLGFCISFYLGDIETNSKRLRTIFNRKERHS